MLRNVIRVCIRENNDNEQEGNMKNNNNDCYGKIRESFTHGELRLVRCDRRDLDRPWLGRVRSAENGSRHFRDQGQPPGEPSA